MRLSGAGAIEVARSLAPLDAARRLQSLRLRLPPGELPCLAIVARAPHSYTGEDVVELFVPANGDLLAALESRLVAAAAPADIDCRRAEPGEFTLRAFLHGRIDLSQAEGIAATIAATNDAQLLAARQLADGALARFVRALADRVADDLALVEAGIDFTDEEDVVAIEPGVLRAHLDEIVGAVDDRLDRSTPLERLEATPRVVLTGAPNAGKSTLFNALLGRRRAVESPTAGTTRDVLEEPLALRSPTGDLHVSLVDLAGVDDGPHGLNPCMQARALDAMASADLVVRCVPADETAASPPGGELLVRTKGDLAPAPGIVVCARTGAGLDALRAEMARRLTARLGAREGETLALSIRHADALRAARDALQRCRADVAARSLRDVELVAASLREALDALGSISGRIAPDEVLGRIFGRFCVGK